VDKAIAATLQNLMNGERYADVALLMDSCPSDAPFILQEVRWRTEADDFGREIGPLETDATLKGDALLVSEKWTETVREKEMELAWRVGLPGVDVNTLVVDGEDRSYHYLCEPRHTEATVRSWGPETELRFPKIKLAPGQHRVKLDYHVSLEDPSVFRAGMSGARVLSWWAVCPSLDAPVYDLKVLLSAPGGRFIQANPPGKTSGPRYEFRTAFTKPGEGRKLDIMFLKK
jgi:hypothetical protein